MIINNLPYINGIPSEGDQVRITWLADGEKITGASSRFGFDGSINRVPVMLQENINTLYENSKTIVSEINNHTKAILSIQAAIGASNDLDLIKSVLINTENIKQVLEAQKIISQAQDDQQKTFKQLDQKVGSRNILDTSSRVILEDLFWIRNELGNYTGQDINGKAADIQSSGLKGRLLSVSSAVTAHDKKITDLQDKFKDSDVGGLTILVQSIKTELYNVQELTNTLNKNQISSAEVIENIKRKIGYDKANIVDRVSDAEKTISTIQTDLDSSIGIKSKLNDLQNVINSRGGLIDQVSQVNQSISSVYNVVGNSTSDGLQGQVSRIIDTIGITSAGNPTPESINGKINSLQNIQTDLSGSFNELSVTVGTNDSGILGDIKKIKNGSVVDLRLKGAVGDGLSGQDEAILKAELDAGTKVFNGGTYKVTDISLVYRLQGTSGTAKVVHYGNVYPFGNIQDQYITLKVPSDFKTIKDALDWVGNKRILGKAGVDITVADGTYVQSWTNNLNHIDGEKISIRGNEKDRTKVVIQLDNRDNRDGFAVSNGHVFGWLNGFTIIGTNGWLSKGNWGDQCYGAAIRAFDGGVVKCGVQIHSDKNYYGLRAMHGGVITAVGSSAVNVKGGGILVTNAGDVGIHAHTATIYCNCAEVYDSGDNAHGLGFGIAAEAGGYIVCEYSVSNGNIKAGYYGLSNGTVWAHGTSAQYNEYGALSWGGTVECNSLNGWVTEYKNNKTAGILSTFRGFIGANAAVVSNNLHGVVSTEGSTVDATAVQAIDNTGHGVYAYDNGYITGYNIQSLRNGLDGFRSQNRSFIKAVSAVSTDNKGTGYIATKFSSIYCPSMGGTGNKVFCSPVQGSVNSAGGNKQSYIDDEV